MLCPLCRFENSGQVRFCGGCGKPLESSSVGDLSMEATYLGGDGASGALVGDRYELIEELGRGGMGVVFLARDQKLARRQVALKRVFPSSEGGTERFLREAQSIASLSHKNIRAVYDQAEDEHGPYLVMEYVEGESLRDLVRRDGPLDDDTFARLTRQLIEALAHAHATGIIHRDVKPGNVLISKDGDAKLTDFGLARQGTDSELSVTGQGMGTLDYTSPEQREDAKRADARSDVFGLGATLYFMLTGESPRTIRQERLPRPWRALVMRCLEERPEARYEGMAAVRAALEEAAETTRLEGDAAGRAGATAATPTPSPTAPSRPRPRWLVPVIVAVLALCGGAYAVLSGQNSSVLDAADQALAEGRYGDIPELLEDLGPGMVDQDRVDFLSGRAVIAEELARLWGDADLPDLVDESLRNKLIVDDARITSAYDEAVIEAAEAEFLAGELSSVSGTLGNLTPQSEQAANKKHVLERLEWAMALDESWPKQAAEAPLPRPVLDSCLDPGLNRARADESFNRALIAKVQQRIDAQAFEDARRALDHRIQSAGQDIEAALLGEHASLAIDTLVPQWRHGDLPAEVVAALSSLAESTDRVREAFNAELEELALAALLEGNPDECQTELNARAPGVRETPRWSALSWRPEQWGLLASLWADGPLPQAVVAALKDLEQDKASVQVIYNAEVEARALESLSAGDRGGLRTWLSRRATGVAKPAAWSALEWRLDLWDELERAWDGPALPAETVMALQDLSQTEVEIRTIYNDEVERLAVLDVEAGRWDALEERLRTKVVGGSKSSRWKSLEWRPALQRQLGDMWTLGALPTAVGQALRDVDNGSAEVLMVFEATLDGLERDGLTASEVDVLLEAKRPLTAEMVDVLLRARRPLTAEMVDVLLEAKRPLTAGMVDVLLQAKRPLTAGMVDVKAKAGERLTWENSIGIELIGLPAGKFRMGSTSGDSDESPVHEVTLTEPFLLGKTEVTQAQWKAVMGTSPSHFVGDDRPVESVSWTECEEFCHRLTEKERRSGVLPEGWKYSLPTEAQWEYACRAGTTTAYSFGDSSSRLSDYAWLNGNSGDRTHPVGGKQANPWGFHDMHGNVREWCLDWYDSEFYGSSEASVDPTGPSSGSYRVARGGGCYSGASYLRSADRDGDAPGRRNRYLGFRLAMVPSE